jgi:MOSC domain-containing protein YiiM
VSATVEEIFITPNGSDGMQRLPEVHALAGCGLEGDRYCQGTGYWTPFGDVCEVTLISGEDLDYIENELGLKVKNGEHRRNIVVRGVDLNAFAGKRFRVGEALLDYDRPRPPCHHVQEMTEPGMTRALVNRGGHCARVIEGGRIREGDDVEEVEKAPLRSRLPF